MINTLTPISHCINLVNKNNKFEKIKSELSRINIYPNRFVVEKHTLTKRILREGVNNKSNQILESHLKLLKHLESIDQPCFIIFEDDIKVIKDIDVGEITSSAPKDWDVIYLGGMNHYHTPKIIDHKFYKCKFSFNAHAFIVKKEFIPKMIEHLEKRECENDVIFAYMQYNGIGNWYGLIEDAIIQDGVGNPTFITTLSDNSFETINKLKGNFNLSKKTPEIDKFYEFVSMCKGLIPYLPKEFPAIDKNSYKKSLLVETRELEHNEFVIKNTIQKLGDGWGHIIYCHNNNYKQIKSICDGISPDIEIRLLDFELNRNSYNNLCLDINFWNEIDCEKVLIYQTDTFIFNKFNDEFLEWDYLGAMWYNSGLNNVIMDQGMKLPQGNGGLSLRTVSLIKESLTDKDFIKNINIASDNMDKLPEDIYFSSYIMIYGKHKENTEDFSIEPSQPSKMSLTFDENPFGFHKLYDFDGYEKFLIPKNFNPYSYLLKTLDLSYNMQITKESLINHFIKNGIQESRNFIIKESKKEKLSKNTKIFLFYHVYCQNNWKTILNNQLNDIRKSELFENLDRLYINVVGNKNDLEFIKTKFSVDENEKINIKIINNNYESDTINLMCEISKTEKFKGLYIHTKSSSILNYLPYKKYSTFWLEFMNYQIISNWMVCNNYLENHDLVGTSYKDGTCEIDLYWSKYSKRNDLSTAHFSGNFFWFNSDYFSKLDKLSIEESKIRYNCEWFPFKGKPKHFEIMINSDYLVDKLYRLIENKDYEVFKNHNLDRVKVTVVITLYNYVDYIESCIDSVIGNTYKDVEVLVVNDCSTDDSLLKVLNYLDNKNLNLTILDKKINSGLAESRNIGIDTALGEYVFILDADNKLYENCIEEHINKIENENTIACYGIIEKFDVEGNYIGNVSNEKFNFNKLKFGNYIDAMAMFNRSKLISIGKYDTEQMNYGCGWEDYELWLKIGKLGLDVGFINKSLSYYLVKEDSMISETNKNIDNLTKYLNKKYDTRL